MKRVESRLLANDDKQGLGEIIELFKSDALKMHSEAFGSDTVHAAWDESRELADTIYEILMKRRRMREFELEEDFKFRNWVDAKNLAYIPELDRLTADNRIAFLGHVPLSNETEVKQHMDCYRNYMVPFLSLSATRMHQRDGKSPNIRKSAEELQFLKKHMAGALSVLESRSIREFEDLTQFEQGYLAEALRHVSGFQSPTDKGAAYSEEKKSILMDMISSPDKIRDSIVENAEVLSKSAQD